MLAAETGLKIPMDLLSRLFRCPLSTDLAVQENSVGILIPPSSEPYRWALLDKSTGLPVCGHA
jgi:hypothetical protein